MKALFFLCVCMATALCSKGQRYNDYAVQIPNAQTYSTTAIAGYIQQNYKTDAEKLNAIYGWVITNIRYDADSMYPINWSLEADEKIAATLRRRKGVCDNYASLFTDIAAKSGFAAFAVSGYTKQSGFVTRAGHSWSAVCLQGRWFLCDPTWDIGNSSSPKYFLVSPEEFIETHMPFDPLWQLLEYPVTEREFRQGRYLIKSHQPLFNYTDTAKTFLAMDSLQQLRSANLRTKLAGIETERRKEWVDYNQMKIAIIYGEKDMNLYNAAVADLNQANGVFNDFVNYRNTRFMPARTDAVVAAMLLPVKGLLASAAAKLDQTGGAVENFQYDTGSIKARIDSLVARLQEQQLFLNRYLASPLAERDKLFYK